MMTTGYNVFEREKNHLVRIEFLDDITVVTGHVNGSLRFSCLGMSTSPTKLVVANEEQG